MIDRFNTREKIALFAGAILLCILLLWVGIISPYQNAIEKYDKKIVSIQKQLIEDFALKSEIDTIREQIDKLDGNLDNEEFDLFAHIESLTVSSGVKANLLSIRPQPPAQQGEYQMESVEVRLEKVTLKQLVRFLESCRNEKRYLPLRQLKIKSRFEDKSKLNATMVIAFFKS